MIKTAGSSRAYPENILFDIQEILFLLWKLTASLFSILFDPEYRISILRSSETSENFILIPFKKPRVGLYMTESFEKAVLNEYQTRIFSTPALNPFPETAIPNYGLLCYLLSC
jgi:hypothetical protein